MIIMTKSIFADKNVKMVPFLWDGKEFQFELTNVSWHQQNEIINKAMTLQPGSKKASFDINAYTKGILPLLIKSTGELSEFNPQDPMIWMKLSQEFGKALEEQIIEPFASPTDSNLSGDDEKN